MGTGKENINNVKNVYVSTAEQGENAMKKALEDNNISLVFLWSVWPETYSYVYYEVLSTGGYVITNNISGNVACMVEEYHNGTVFRDYDEFLLWLKDFEAVRNIINEYRINYGYKPEVIVPNQNLDDIVPPYKEMLISDKQVADAKRRKTGKSKILTWIYKRMKYG